MKNQPTHCPECGADFQGEPIPQEYIDKGHYGEHTHFSRIIALIDQRVDRVVSWACPDCKHEWPRK
jgi:predicted RNA-binding Zn-ribbon protein involved in translation (DUF1610 family)